MNPGAAYNANATGGIDPDDPTSLQSKLLVARDPSPKTISHLQFGLLSASEMQRLSEFQVSSSQLFKMPERTPAHNGPLDPRMGVSDKTSVCKTCSLKLVDCAGHFGFIKLSMPVFQRVQNMLAETRRLAGHFGFIKLSMPVFHIGFFKHTLNLLQSICKTCARVLLSDADRAVHLRRMRHPRTDVLARGATFKKVLDKCKKSKSCPHCHAANGTVKKIHGVSTLKIVHEKYKGKAMEDEIDDLVQNLQSAMSLNKDLSPALKTAVEDLLPTRVLDLFQRMTDEDCEILWLDPLIGRPENLILQTLLVPPVPIRPSVAMDSGGGSNEDDLTVKLQEIIDVNVAMELAMGKGPHTRTIMEEWDFLQ
eukprot:CAMPEP_0194395550 /NCGR_PEP_ID=MMETSP0174-20130528/124485_1 /TAXON_ID=216777 /ORGANISM="Proboscia alata, Strain PI-D3" /LENGTH=364 /DNA_ID=CAMNT_0039191497 /DNA_START=123 /DNA_END=1215 /DNA_ORIENTATION=+